MVVASPRICQESQDEAAKLLRTYLDAPIVHFLFILLIIKSLGWCLIQEEGELPMSYGRESKEIV